MGKLPPPPAFYWEGIWVGSIQVLRVLRKALKADFGLLFAKLFNS